MKINPLNQISKISQMRATKKYLHWALDRKNVIKSEAKDNYPNYSKLKKIIPKAFMVWIGGIQCYFLAKNKDMPPKRKTSLIFNEVYSSAIALIAGALLKGKIDNMTSKIVKRAEKIYTNPHEKATLLDGIKSGVPFLTEAILFMVLGPIVATPLATQTTNSLEKKGIIDFHHDKDKFSKNKRNRN